MDRRSSINFGYIVLAFFGVMLLQSLFQEKHTETVPYSEFVNYLEDGRLSEVVVSSQYIQGTLSTSGSGQPQHIIATLVDPAVSQALEQYDIPYSAVVENTMIKDLVGWFLPIIVFAAIWLFFIRRMAEKQGMGGGAMSIGKSKAKVYLEKDTKTTFRDVAGVDEAKEELEEIVAFLKAPDSYSRLGARMPKGILLVGPPGTGKTLMARAVAGEAGVPFFSISGSEFVEMFVGVGAARVRDLFEQARKQAPAIIFIDELDALGRARGAYPGMGGHDEKEQTLNQLLSELDGFDPRDGLVLLAATNRPEILDPALLRAGRFDRQVLVDRPDKSGRIAILKVHMQKAETANDVDLEEIASLTPGFSGADLANLVNEAALLATRHGADSVSLGDFNLAIERIVAGLEKRNRLLNPREREVVAYHEMGHALVAMTLPGSDVVHKVSIIPRGIGALGYTIQRPTEDRFLMSENELKNKMAVLLGGRAAEALVFDEVSTGAADDLSKATDIARNMVTRFGMHSELGQMTYETEPHQFLGGAASMTDRLFSEETAHQIDTAVKSLIQEAFEAATTVLQNKRAMLETCAKELLETETLDKDQLTDLTS